MSGASKVRSKRSLPATRRLDSPEVCLAVSEQAALAAVCCVAGNRGQWSVVELLQSGQVSKNC